MKNKTKYQTAGNMAVFITIIAIAGLLMSTCVFSTASNTTMPVQQIPTPTTTTTIETTETTVTETAITETTAVTPVITGPLPDPTKWTAAETSTIFGSPTERPTTHTPNSVHAVAFGNGRFVAVGDRGKIAYSEDGVKWTAVVNNTFEDKNILSIAFGGGKFVAVGMQGKMAYSIDGLTWTAVNDNTFSPYVILDIAYGNGKFIAIGGARQISASTDGITWTVVNNTLFAGGFAPLSFVTYGNRGFVIGRSNITCAACHPHMGHSTDGITWTGVPNDVFNLRGNGIFNAAYGDNKYIAIGGTGSGASPNSGKGIITQSADGINWTEVSARDVFGTEPIYAIAYGGGYFVAAGGEIGSDYNTIKGIGFSADGITWTAINSSAFTENDLVRNIAYGNGRFVIVGDAYTRVGNNPMRTWFGRIWYSDTIPVN